nr:hypothetical protein K34PH164_LOCUS25 [Klebsiella phage vB_Kpn_K34PH164]
MRSPWESNGMNSLKWRVNNVFDKMKQPLLAAAIGLVLGFVINVLYHVL